MSTIPETDPSSRMQIRSRGEIREPGSCYVCGNGNCDLGYLDFGTFVDYHGNFYLCVTCTIQAAETIGFTSPDGVQFITEQLTKVTAELDETKAELADARKYVDSVNSMLASRHYNGSGSSVINADGTKQPEVSKSPFKAADDGESESTEPTARTGRKQSAGSKPRDITFRSDSK